MPQLWGARNEILKGRVGLNSIWKVNPLGGLLTRSLIKWPLVSREHVDGYLLSQANGEEDKWPV